MAQQTIGIGSIANDGLGDPLRTAFTKVNANDTELYAADASRVVGPSSATDDTLVKFDGTTGKLVKQGPAVTSFAATLLDDADAATARTTLGVNTSAELATETKTLTNKTLTAPVISTIVNSGTLTLPTSTGTLALTSDITGTNSGTNTGDQFLFRTISVSGQSDIVADSTTDTLTLAAGGGVTLTTNATTDTLTIALSGGVGSGDMLAGNNLSELTNTATARTNLGVAIGTNVQAYDADLDSWSSVTRAAGFDTFAATPSSANLAALVTNETGSGALVFATSPTLVTPALGTPASGVLTSCTAATQSALDNSTKLATTAYVYSATREKLSAARTYYVRSDGSDSNTGLANTSGAAWLTPQKAMDYISEFLDLGPYVATVNIADGTYAVSGASVLALKSYARTSGYVAFVGNTTTPGNVAFTATNADAIASYSGTVGYFDIRGVKVSSVTSGNGLFITGPGIDVALTSMNFGACAGNQCLVSMKCRMIMSGTNYVSGNASVGFWSTRQAMIYMSGCTINYLSAAAYSVRNFNCGEQSWIDAFGVTFSGSAASVTGQRYYVDGLSGVFTNGGGASYVPGNSAGGTNNGGVYY